MERWEDLKAECAGCDRCELGRTRTNLVFGVGNENADILFIGEGPGEQEDLQGIPFVGPAGKLLDTMLEIIGPAGKLLDTMLEIIGLDRTKVYIANIVKCRPPRNRDPLPDEQQACIGWLFRQIELIQPKILVFLGRIAATAFIRPDFRISKEHGQWFEVMGRPAMAIYHPSALLRAPSKRPETFVDLKQLQQEIKKLT